MSRQIFLVYFLFLCVCCQLWEQGCAAQTAQSPGAANLNSIVDFITPEDGKIQKALEPTVGSKEEIKISVYHIESVFLLATDGFMVALAEVNYSEKSPDEKKNNVLAKYTRTKIGNWVDEAFKKNVENWEAELATKQNKKTNNKAVIKSFAAAANKKYIYHITVSNDTFEDNGPSSTPPEWHVRLVVGEVTDSESGGTEKIIKGTTPKASVKYDDKSQLKAKLNTEFKTIPTCDSFAFLTGEAKKNIVFLMKCKATNDADKNITAVFQLEEISDDNNELKLLNVDNAVDCYPSFFQWKGEIYKAPTDDSKCNNNELMVFNASEETKFTKASSSVVLLRGFLRDKSNFATATIGDSNDDVLLFTQIKKLEKKKNVYLWMTDGTRVGYVGNIVEGIVGTENTFYGSILHTNDELFALHQKYQTGASGSLEKEANKFSLTRLTDQLDKIKIFLNEWKRNKEIVSKLCDNIDKQKFICTKAPPTNGLVGFLHSTTNGNSNNVIWKDEYCFSSVTVVKGEAENAPNGLKFSGAGKGAEWSMQNQQKEKPYNFIISGFTFVATVEIGSDTNGKRNSILGVSLTNTNTNNVGLWCNTDGKWGVSGRDNSALKLSGKECKQAKTYNVALVLGRENDKNLEIYVNGEKLTTEKITIEPSESIENFYFGARIESDESHVTVTNVLLYNRPFNPGEIGNLKNYVRSVEVVTPHEQNVDTNTAGGNSDEPTPPPIPTSTKEKGEDEKEPSPSRTEDGGVGGGVRVFSLLLAVLCVSAPLLHL